MFGSHCTTRFSGIRKSETLGPTYTGMHLAKNESNNFSVRNSALFSIATLILKFWSVSSLSIGDSTDFLYFENQKVRLLSEIFVGYFTRL
jgi:hypothetical protein